MKFIALLLLCLSPFAFAKSHAPLPDALLNAKTAYIINETGYQEVADSAYDSLSKWNHFSIVQARENADIVLVFSLTLRMSDGDSVRRTVMSVQAPNSTDSLFQTTERRDAFSNYGTSAKNCIATFRKRLEVK